MLIKILDPNGVAQRSGRRLKRRVYRNKVYMYNDDVLHVYILYLISLIFVWQLHGYDMLKPYGFAIHGCIDGYVSA